MCLWKNLLAWKKKKKKDTHLAWDTIRESSRTYRENDDLCSEIAIRAVFPAKSCESSCESRGPSCESPLPKSCESPFPPARKLWIDGEVGSWGEVGWGACGRFQRLGCDSRFTVGARNAINSLHLSVWDSTRPNSNASRVNHKQRFRRVQRHMPNKLCQSLGKLKTFKVSGSNNKQIMSHKIFKVGILHQGHSYFPSEWEGVCVVR